jgi:nitrogen PTS system EIIA component
MELGDLITLDAIVPKLAAKTKKQVLQDLADKAAALTGLDGREILEALLQRERVGSTAMGRGIAIPHGRLAGLERIVSVFARLEEPIDFEAPDEEPVDLIFVLLAPEDADGDHLKALARVSRLAREPQMVERLRSSHDRAALHRFLTETSTVQAA